MIITSITANLREDASIGGGRTRHEVLLDDAALMRHVQRLVASDGTEVGLRLPTGHPGLRDGDVLAITDTDYWVVRAAPTDVLVIRPRSMGEMGRVAHALGNRHLPAQFAGDAMLVAYDHTVGRYLDENAIPYDREERVLPEPFRHAEHTH